MGWLRTTTLLGVWLLIVYEFISYNVLFVPGFSRTVPLC